MSGRTEKAKESSRFENLDLSLLEDWYHVPLLAVLFGFMLWVRLQAYDRFIRGNEVFFAGNDAWYHLRQVTYTVRNWPATMPYDPWTYFPYGTSAGQFGTLFDQLIATAALIVGLGSPDEKTIALTLLVAPAVFGALVAIPTYFIGKRLGGRLGGLFGVLILALLPGVFLGRGLVGSADHNVAEPFFQAFAVLAMMVAVSVGEREKPIYELVAERDVDALYRPLAWSVLAGIATALYLWMWPPGVLLVGIFGAFYLVKLVGDYLRGVSPDHLAFVAAVSMTVTALLMLVPLGRVSGFSPTDYSLLQPLVALSIAVGSIFMAWLAREWDSRDIPEPLYPAAIFGILAAGVGIVYVALPSLYGTIRTNLVRFVGFGAGAQTRTIGEAQPFLDQVQTQYGIMWYDVVMREYGLMFFTAAVGALLMLWRAYRHDEHHGERLLVVVWAVFITSAAFTQVRFNYYLVVPVAVLNAYLIGQVLRMVDLTSVPQNIRDIEGYQILAVVFVVLLIVPVLVVPAQIGSAGGQSFMTSTAIDKGGNTGPGAVTQWDPTLEWMAENTPAEGNYGGAGNEMEYYGTYAEEDGDFDYSKGAYGVMSWWDYGHWITAEGERIPNANPFQEGAKTAANYLLAQSEGEANEIIDTLSEDGEQTRYVMVDWKMVDTDSRDRKFFAPVTFKDNVSQSDFYEPLYQQTGQGGLQYTGVQLRSQDYYESQMVRLYQYHGSAMEPRPVVVDYDNTSAQTGSGPVTIKTLANGENQSAVRTFSNMQQARQFVEEDGSARIGGIGSFPTERVPALQHYRLVRYSDSSALSSGNYIQTLQQQAMATGLSPQALINSPAWVKTFERVPGATVEGTAPAGSTVTASVEMQIPNANRTFTYTQQATAGQNGEFTMTLPYASTGAENWGPKDGYTNTSVRATGPYEFRTGETAEDEGFVFHNATAQVSEAKVIGEDDSPVTVQVDNRQVREVEGANNSSSANESSPGNETGGNATAGNSTANATALVSQLTVKSASGSDGPQDSRHGDTATRAGLVGAAAAAAVAVGRRD